MDKPIPDIPGGEAAEIAGPRGFVSIRAIAMPRDTNPAGDIFGGWLLSQMDVAGGTLAHERARGRVVTVAVDRMVFHRPVQVGEEVTCYTEIVRVGRSSITIRVEAWVRKASLGEPPYKVTEGLFTYVAVGPDRKPRPVPELG